MIIYIVRGAFYWVRWCGYMSRGVVCMLVVMCVEGRGWVEGGCAS